MALTLQLADLDGHPLSESYAVLDDELLAYLSGLDGFPALRRVGELPPEEETPIEEEDREALAREAAEVAMLASRRELPPPPDWVGLEGTGDIRLGEEFGWRGLLDFLRRLEHLLHLCRTMGTEMWALPE
ncbi:MAG TPA: hypothetical protein VHC97_11220 [Thermoanaerobaculia bacterium]|jgi:hypothetical protein|nr:hypothetical protein [Thermoanaerobaculia bacterium]